MSRISLMTGCPCHIEKIPHTPKNACKHYENGECTKLLVGCLGRSQCPVYKAERKKIAEQLTTSKDKNKNTTKVSTSKAEKSKVNFNGKTPCRFFDTKTSLCTLRKWKCMGPVGCRCYATR